MVARRTGHHGMPRRAYGIQLMKPSEHHAIMNEFMRLLKLTFCGPRGKPYDSGEFDQACAAERRVQQWSKLGSIMGNIATGCKSKSTLGSERSPWYTQRFSAIL